MPSTGSMKSAYVQCNWYTDIAEAKEIEVLYFLIQMIQLAKCITDFSINPQRRAYYTH